MNGKRRVIVLVAAAVVVAAAIVIWLSVKNVPEGREGLRVGKNGDTEVYSSGIHLVLPGYADFIDYPTGEVVFRAPESGTASVLTETGEEVAVAFEVTVEVARGGAKGLYQRFGKDFNGAVERLILETAEIEAAVFPGSSSRTLYQEAVGREIRAKLSSAGVGVSGYTLLVWGDDVRSRTGVPDKPLRRLMVVGIDGGDWLNLSPLIDAGTLPNFKKLIENGSTGPLRSIEPTLSPLLWTSMATGKYPEDHGILNFTIDDPESGKKVPITRHYRKVDAFWNMLGDYGRSVCIAGWLATHPAEEINGVMVTDKIGYLAYAPANEDQKTPGSVYPENRLDEISALVERGPEIDFDEFSNFIHISRDEFNTNREIEFDPKNSINTMILLYASTNTYMNIAQHLLEKDDPDLMAVYFEWVDAVSHLFMLHSPPKLPDISEDEYRKFKDAVAQSYIYQDEMLGRIMDGLGDETVLMVVSDHGFKSGASRMKNRPEIWAGNAAKWHRINGIIGLYGSGVKKGHKIKDASILDVTPTILALQGLPKAADMPGRVLTEAFDADLVDAFNPTVVATLEKDRGPDQGVSPGSGTASAETMKKLEALGYLAPDNANAHNNLGQRYQERGEYLKAIEEYEKALVLQPDFHSVYNNIAVCYGKLQRFSDAERALIKAIEIKPDDFYAMNNLAVTYISTGKMDQAQKVAERIVEIEPGYVNGRITLGSIYAMTGRFEEAEKEFEKALVLEPDNQQAADNLRRVRQEKKGS